MDDDVKKTKSSEEPKKDPAFGEKGSTFGERLASLMRGSRKVILPFAGLGIVAVAGSYAHLEQHISDTKTAIVEYFKPDVKEEAEELAQALIESPNRIHGALDSLIAVDEIMIRTAQPEDGTRYLQSRFAEGGCNGNQGRCLEAAMNASPDNYQNFGLANLDKVSGKVVGKTVITGMATGVRKIYIAGTDWVSEHVFGNEPVAYNTPYKNPLMQAYKNPVMQQGGNSHGAVAPGAGGYSSVPGSIPNHGRDAPQQTELSDRIREEQRRRMELPENLPRTENSPENSHMNPVNPSAPDYTPAQPQAPLLQ